MHARSAQSWRRYNIYPMHERVQRSDEHKTRIHISLNVGENRFHSHRTPIAEGNTHVLKTLLVQHFAQLQYAGNTHTPFRIESQTYTTSAGYGEIARIRCDISEWRKSLFPVQKTSPLQDVREISDHSCWIEFPSRFATQPKGSNDPTDHLILRLVTYGSDHNSFVPTEHSSIDVSKSSRFFQCRECSDNFFRHFIDILGDGKVVDRSYNKHQESLIEGFKIIVVPTVNFAHGIFLDAISHDFIPHWLSISGSSSARNDSPREP